MNPVCETILMRQFDPDCRDGSALPADVQSHLASCASCRQEWQLGAAFDQQLQQQLPLEPSAALYRRSYAAVFEQQQNQQQRWQLWRKIGVSLLLGLATAASVKVLAGFLYSDWVGLSLFCCTSLTLFLLSQYLEPQETA